MTKTTRKTIEVETLRTYANKLLALNISSDTKEGICTMIEKVLRETNNYQGFNYNYWIMEGYDKWMALPSKDRPQGIPKDEYIFGPTGCRYSRYYYGSK
jgi:hypothetical protein